MGGRKWIIFSQLLCDLRGGQIDMHDDDSAVNPEEISGRDSCLPDLFLTNLHTYPSNVLL